MTSDIILVKIGKTCQRLMVDVLITIKDKKRYPQFWVFYQNNRIIWDLKIIDEINLNLRLTTCFFLFSELGFLFSYVNSSHLSPSDHTHTYARARTHAHTHTHTHTHTHISNLHKLLFIFKCVRICSKAPIFNTS